VLSGGVVGVTPTFEIGGEHAELPRFQELILELGDVVGRGVTAAEALARLRSLIGTAPGTGAQWIEARRWFVRMDQARRSGDWAEFGRAWRELERTLGVARDSGR
jgi:hypothetical protein